MSTPTLMTARRFSGPRRLRLHILFAKAFEALGNLGIWTATKCMASFGWAKFKPIAEPTTFHQWVRNQFGEKLFSIFFKTYTEKVWGMQVSDMPADWAAQRVKNLSLLKAITNSLMPKRNDLKTILIIGSAAGVAATPCRGPQEQRRGRTWRSRPWRCRSPRR